jgi:hypothetical protein
MLVNGRRERAILCARTSITYALMPGKLIAFTQILMTKGGQDLQESGSPNRTIAAEPLDVDFVV